jgi:HEAT repeat protein
LLSDQDKDLRCIAVFALGEIGKAAIPSLKLAAQDENQEVRAKALLALENIRGTI